MKALNTLLACAAALIVASCANTGKLEMNGPALVGGEWVAVGDNQAIIDEAIRTTARFGADGKVSGEAGCNTYFGEYKLGPGFGVVSTSAIGSTKLACEDEEVMWQEGLFLDILGHAQYYTFDETGHLIVTATDGRTLLLRRQGA